MNTYITGAAIKHLRQAKGLTQAELGDQIGVSAKAVSKWETARGLPDITLIEPLAEALSVSVLELMAGAPVINRNVSSNLLRSRLYVCPVGGNVIHATGDSVVSCCGIVLPALEAEEPDEAHRVIVEKVEDEFFLRVHHDQPTASAPTTPTPPATSARPPHRPNSTIFPFLPWPPATGSS